ncbi:MULTISPECIES: LysR family transcriptional regulator [Sphingobium]|jgi:DNA-binding transcriptional LysR family regulator|uniref:LysR family transcriptional regulator n=1 Tax=Sphingobium fuliginis (strain ATCC 27551) TaxID=336203 RepID=A0A4Q4IWY2_SPHSA|nr:MULTISPECIES: LysR family transcriptional regulator [Sphingobium]AJR23282.1 transcriptional regulator [Sphingobium sp. YBL2]QOT73347.1 LysR family transcriptional regulator [Sphingobium fuliginis]RYL98085.1 LysR family transcriptional regulator [Sphingobium fuliginis]WDA34792.1 LysR substrate-binding domain-containing protein [Sphingobium sp. YC-XJ3]GFZ92124.1 LysR family transcriptional regulator [Sphingobium fuliginis]
MDRLTAMEAFVAVAEAGSFTRAALRLNISTPMVTLHVRRLEEHLGVRLFNRSTRRVDLTAEGGHYLTYAQAALDAVATADMAVRPGAGIAGRVRLDAPASMGQAFVMPALAEFQRAHPQLILDLTLGDRGTFFRVDGFDLVIRAGEAPPTGWKTLTLGTTRLICLASPDYIAQHGQPSEADDLTQHRAILYASVEMPGGNPLQLRHGDRTVRVRPPTAFTFNDGAAILSATLAGLGVGQTLEMLARDHIRAGRLIPLLPEANWPRLPVVLMGAPDRIALPHVQAALAFLTERIDWRLDPG